MRATRVGGFVLAIALCAACASIPAPSGWLPTAKGAATDAFGGWITVTTAAQTAQNSASPRAVTEGELIAVHPDSLFVLTEGALVAVPRARVQKATLFAYDPHWGALGAWGVLGTLFAISNGWYFALTGPTWVITTAIAAGSRSRASSVSLDDSAGWERLRAYARFPQGLPAGLDRATLLPRPRRIS